MKPSSVLLRAVALTVLLSVVQLCNAQELCNGLPNLCGMHAHEILYGIPHNAMSSPSAGFILLANHIEDPIVASLDAGYRGLSLDLCHCNGNFVFCHGNSDVGCGIGRRDPVEVFDQVNNWIISNPRNVLVIHLQINEGAGGPIVLNDVQNILEQVPNGFADRIYHHEPRVRTWPTLQELIDAETQVLFFYVSGPNGSGDHPPGINYFYHFGMSNHFSYKDVDDLRDRTLESCEIRAQGGTREFLLMNAFVTKERFGVQFIPSRDAAEEINTIEFSKPLLDACEQFNGQKVNIISVDFWSEGDLPALVNLHNAELVPPPTTPAPAAAPTTPRPTGSPSSSPTRVPIAQPSAGPTSRPSSHPSVSPTSSPSSYPSSIPTLKPSSHPSSAPTSHPSSTPSRKPTSVPNIFPSRAPNVEASVSPTGIPDSLEAQALRGEVSSAFGIKVPISALIVSLAGVFAALLQ